MFNGTGYFPFITRQQCPSSVNDIAAYERPVAPDRYPFPPVNSFMMRSFTNFVTLLGCTGAYVNAFPQLKEPLPNLHNESPTLEKRVSFDASSVSLSLERDDLQSILNV